MESSFEKMTNSRLFGIGEVLWDLLVLSVVWLLFSLPIVTIGNSTAALYFAVHRRFRLKTATPLKDFLRSFKLNLKQGIPITILFLIYAAAAGFNIAFAFKGFGGIMLPEWYLPFSLLLLIPLLIAYPMTFPYLARFNTDTKHLLLNSCMLSVMNPGRSLLICIYTIICIASIVFFPPAVLIAPAGTSFLIMMSAEKTFDNALANENSRNSEEDAADE